MTCGGPDHIGIRLLGWLGCALALTLVTFAVPRPGRADSTAPPVGAGILVLPSGQPSPEMEVILTELRLGFDNSLRGARVAPRFRALLSPTDLTNDLDLINLLSRVESLYGMAEGSRKALVDRIQQLPIKEGDFRAILRVLVSRSGNALQVSLQLADLDRRSFNIVQTKTLEGPDLPDLRPRLRKAGRLLLVQEDQGVRPSPRLIPAVVDPRVGKEVAVEVRDLEDPEYDVVDWAWCLAAAPKTSEVPVSRGWHRGDHRIAFTPDSEGAYTFLLWSAETLRGEEEPDCDPGGPVPRLTIEVGPTSRWNAFTEGSYERGSLDQVTKTTFAVRLGVEYLLYRRLGVRVTLDLLQSEFGTKASPEAGGALTLGLGWRIPVTRELRFTPHLSVYSQHRETFVRPQLGLGAGGDLRIQLWTTTDMILSIDGYAVNDLNHGGDDGGFTRLRFAGGLARAF